MGQMKNEKLLGNAQGFTVIEIVVVIVVLGIAATLVLLKFNTLNAEVRDADRKADIRLIESKLSEYKSATEAYPPSLSELSNLPDDAKQDMKGVPYLYEAKTADNKTCNDDSKDECMSYKVSTVLEASSELYVRTSP